MRRWTTYLKRALVALGELEHPHSTFVPTRDGESLAGLQATPPDDESTRDAFAAIVEREWATPPDDRHP